MRLIDVYQQYEVSCVTLFALMREREPHESISHKVMPSWEDHCAFVASKPYAHWYIVEVDGYVRGEVYLSKQREIGVAIFKGQRGHGYGMDAVAQLMRLHPGRFLANINPANEASLTLFKALEFIGPIQVTMEKPA